MDINELIIYRNLEYQELFQDMACLMGYADSGSRPDAFHCAGQLVELAVNYGFEGNLWHCFLAFCLANNENAYTTSCEITGAAGGSLDRLAREDFKIFNWQAMRIPPLTCSARLSGLSVWRPTMVSFSRWALSM